MSNKFHATANGKAIEGEFMGDQVIDVNANRAQRIEAGQLTIPVLMGDSKFQFPTPKEWDVRFLTHLNQGDFPEAIRVILDDDEEYERFMAEKPKLGDMEFVLEEITKAAGMGGIPNSGPSAKFSKNTPTR